MIVGPDSSGDLRNLFRDPEAVTIRHVGVEQHQPIGMAVLGGADQRLERRAAARHNGRHHAPPRDLLVQDAAVDRVVVDDQHGQRRQRRQRLGNLGRWERRGLERRGEMEGAADADRALDPDPAPIIFTSVSEMVSPRPVPPKRRVVEPSAWLNASKMVDCLSGAMPMPVSVTTKCSLVQLSARASSRICEQHVARLGELDGVADQVDEHLPQPERVAEDRGGNRRIQIAQQLEPLLLGGQREGLEQILDQQSRSRTAPPRARACAPRSWRSRGCR